MGQKTGSPVFARLVAISPPFAKLRGNVSVSFGLSLMNIIKAMAGRICGGAASNTASRS
jgi:hypothetical protein